MATSVEATIEDLARVEGKAELVDGKIVEMSPEGDGPNRAGGKIFASLLAHERQSPSGRAYMDNAGFRVDLPHRKSFSPDAAWYTGPRTGMHFLGSAPDFAVEVRSEGGYGPAAERAMRCKRADYFAAGTLVVWDVDLLASDVVRVYRASDPDHSTMYRRGQVAEAEPAVPGWRLAVDALFD